MYDRDFQFGKEFDKQIKRSIAHAHVVMPVLTPSSVQRNWVHQEIGYASALNIPVLPLAIGKLPGEMIEHLHAVRVAPGNIEALRDTLTLEHFRSLVREKAGSAFALYQCAGSPDERAEWLASFSNDVVAQGGAWLLAPERWFELTAHPEGGTRAPHLAAEIRAEPPSP